MPELFGHDELAKIERHAVAVYLASLGGPVQPKDSPKRDANSIGRGQKLFTSAGCIACHGTYPGTLGENKEARRLSRCMAHQKFIR